MATADGVSAQAWSCPSDGYITKYDRCTKLSNGVLMVGLADGGGTIETGYNKTGGSTVSAKLGYLRTGTNHWGASTSMAADRTYYKLWSGVGSACSGTNGLLYSGGTTYQTPAADFC
ncbi:hypothetical protein [Streptomyces sp. NPDC102282]|uniref:hypothetical protein n=1 Tax=Streptomyces sp. NPDC102282 TaxID=3366154 RepID=UPI00381D766B